MLLPDNDVEMDSETEEAEGVSEDDESEDEVPVPDAPLGDLEIDLSPPQDVVCADDRCEGLVSSNDLLCCDAPGCGLSVSNYSVRTVSNTHRQTTVPFVLPRTP